MGKKRGMFARTARGRGGHDSPTTDRGGNSSPEAATSELLDHAIERERAVLLKAESLTICLKRALEADTQLVRGPYYPEIVEMIRVLIKQAFDGLDSVNLPSPRTVVRTGRLRRPVFVERPDMK